MKVIAILLLVILLASTVDAWAWWKHAIVANAVHRASKAGREKRVAAAHLKEKENITESDYGIGQTDQIDNVNQSTPKLGIWFVPFLWVMIILFLFLLVKN